MSIVPSEKYNMAGHGADRREPSRYLRHSGHKFFALICFLFLSFIIIADSARAQNSDAFMADLFHAKESQIGFFQIDLGLPDISSQRDIKRHYIYSNIFSQIISIETRSKFLKCRAIITMADYPLLSGFWFSELTTSPYLYTVSYCAQELTSFIQGLKIDATKVHFASLRIYKNRIESKIRNDKETDKLFEMKNVEHAMKNSVMYLLKSSHPAYAILSISGDRFKYLDHHAFLDWFYEERSRGGFKILVGKNKKALPFDNSQFSERTTVKSSDGSLIRKKVSLETPLQAVILLYLHPRLEKNYRADHPAFDKYCSNLNSFNNKIPLYKCLFTGIYLGMTFAALYVADTKLSQRETIKALENLADSDMLKDAAMAGEEHGFGSIVLIEFVSPDQGSL